MAAGESLQDATALRIALLPMMSEARVGSAVITLSLKTKYSYQTITKLWSL